jgi:hypothetical protein
MGAMSFDAPKRLAIGLRAFSVMLESGQFDFGIQSIHLECAENDWRARGLAPAQKEYFDNRPEFG